MACIWESTFLSIKNTAMFARVIPIPPRVINNHILFRDINNSYYVDTSFVIPIPFFTSLGWFHHIWDDIAGIEIPIIIKAIPKIRIVFVCTWLWLLSWSQVPQQTIWCVFTWTVSVFTYKSKPERFCRMILEQGFYWF